MRRLLNDPDGRADLALAVTVWIFSAIVYWGASLLPPPIFDPVGSAAIPKLISVILAVLSALILCQRLMELRHRQPALAEQATDNADMPLRPGLALACIAIMAGYVAVMNFHLLGFREATVPFVVLLGGTLCRFRRSTVVVITISALAIAIGFSWLFSEILYIDLPVTRWPWR